MATRTRKPAAPKVAPVAPATPVYSEEMLAVARESLKDHKNRARIAHALGMGEFKLNGIQRSIREKMGLTDTKEACRRLLAHVQALASPASEATDMVAEAVTKCAKTPEPTANPAWLLTIRELEGKLADATRRAQSAENLLSNERISNERLEGIYEGISTEHATALETIERNAQEIDLLQRERDALHTQFCELRGILMPAMGIDEEAAKTYSLADAAQGVVDMSADRLSQLIEVRKEATRLDTALSSASKVAAEKTARVAATEEERNTAQGEAQKISRRLKAWQAIGILGALVSALLGAGQAYWGIRK